MIAAAVRVIVIVPSVVRVIETSIIIIVSDAVTVIPVPCIQVAPAVAAVYFHPQVAVIIIIVVIGIPVFVLIICSVGLFLWFCSGIINIVRGLTGFIGSGTAAENQNS